MDIESYKIFLAIAKHKSFAKVAELFCVTPPAISHTVSLLEDEFGPLFKRNKKGISLTTTGESIYPYINEVVLKDEALRQLVSEFKGLSKGHVKLGIFNSMLVYLVDIINKVKEDFPNITFEIYQGSYENIISWIKDGVCDIGFLSKTINKDFMFYEIFKDPLVVILPKDTKTLSDTYIDLNEIKEMPFVMQRESCDADAKKIMNELNLDFKTTCHITDDLTAVNMVKSGFGVAIMPKLTMKDLNKDIKMLKIVPEESRVIGAVVKDIYNLSPAAKKVLEYIKNYNYKDIEV